MTTLQYAVAGRRLRVSVDGVSREYDGPSGRLGRLELRRTATGWSVLDSGVAGGVFLDGCRIEQCPLPEGRELTLTAGGPEGPAVVLEVLDDLAPEPEPAAVPSPRRPVAGAVSLGRGPENTLVLDDPLVSREHAVLERWKPAMLRDLGSFNGTYVNGNRITAIPLRPGDEVTIGSHSFTWDGTELTPASGRAGRALVAERLSTVTGHGVRILEAVSLSFAPASLTAVIGPSGAGKSTLLRALAGLEPATWGRMLWDGHNLYEHYGQLRSQIGVVPQEEILHSVLTVDQGLDYAARLRLPPDTGREERRRRIDEVMVQLGLEHHGRHRIGTELSGGQRKRVSIATELLTAPPLLFLDEPTSGLDPGLDRSVMQQLRTLADEDRIVVVVTHSVLALDVCDTVVVMAPGGRVAYAGPPDGLLDHFGCADYPQLFGVLDDPGLARRLPSPQQTDSGSLLPLNRPLEARPQGSWHRQLATLVRRDVALLRADRLLTALLLLMPLALGALTRVVQGDAGLSLRLTKNAQGALVSEQVTQRLTILIVAAAVIGVAMTVRELVKERAILRREYAVGLAPGLAFASKALVLGCTSFLQGVAVTWLALLGLPGQDAAGVHGWGWLEIAVPIGLLAFTMAVVGLVVSAVVRSVEQTMPALVALVMAQLVLSSAVVQLAGRPVLDAVSWLSPSRWAFAASAASVNLDRAKRGVPDAVRDPLFGATADQWHLDLLALVGLAVLAFAVGVRLTARGVRARR